MQNNWRDWMTHLLAVEEVDMDALPATKDTKAIGFAIGSSTYGVVVITTALHAVGFKFNLE